MTLARFLEMADALDGLGWAVRAQLEEVCEGDSLDSKNPAALEVVWEWLDRNSLELVGAREIADEIGDHLAALKQARLGGADEETP